MKKPVYPILAGEIAKRGIKKYEIADALGITSRALYNRLNGQVEFTWGEVCTLQSGFFPEIEKDLLLHKNK